MTPASKAGYSLAVDTSLRRGGPPLSGANLEDSGQNRRLRLGAIMLAVSLVLSVAVVQADLATPWRLGLFVPFFFAAFGAWQGLYRTCPGLVHQGCRETCSGPSKVADPSQLKAARRLAARVVGGSLVTALMATTLVVLLP